MISINRRIYILKAIRLIGIALLVVCLLKVSLWHVENDIREAAYKHAFRNLYHNPDTWKVSFIGVRYGCTQDFTSIPVVTTPFLLNRFKSSKPPVKSESECRYDDSKHQIVDKKTGKTGVVFYTGAIWWVSPNTVKIEVGYYEGLVSASGNIYTLKKKNGRWVIVNDKMLFIS